MVTSIHTKHHQEILKHLTNISGNVPRHRKASKFKYSFSDQPFEEQLALWNDVWNSSQNFWIKTHAFFFLERNMKNETALKQMWPVIVNWQNNIDDWPLCDGLSKIYTRILELTPAPVYKRLQKWNKDPDLWKRRQSVVSLLYYSRTKKIFLPFAKIERLISHLLKDKEYYVQKGVGWALRELHTVYPKEAKAYLKKNIRSISSIAFTIAIEKMGAAEKDSLKKMRK